VPNLEAVHSKNESLSNVQENTSDELWCDDGYDNLFAMIENDYICKNQGKIFFFFIKRV